MSSNSFHFTESFTSEVTTRNKVRTPSSVSKSHSTANFARTGYAASNRPGNTASVSRIAADLIELQNRGLSRQSASAAIARSTSALQIQQRNCPNYQPPAPRSPPCNQPCNQPQPCRNEPCAASQTFLSSVESAILRANVPIEVNETEEITVNGERGIWANRAEVNNWKGCVPLGEYQINVDPNPEVITKRACQMLECKIFFFFIKLIEELSHLKIWNMYMIKKRILHFVKYLKLIFMNLKTDYSIKVV